jgi:hypothetical protein
LLNIHLHNVQGIEVTSAVGVRCREWDLPTLDPSVLYVSRLLASSPVVLCSAVTVLLAYELTYNTLPSSASPDGDGSSASVMKRAHV